MKVYHADPRNHRFKLRCQDMLVSEGLTVKEYAEKVGVSAKTCYHWFDPACTGAYPAYILPIHVERFSPTLLYDLVYTTGHACVPLPREPISPGDAAAVAAQLTRDVAEILHRFAQCVEGQHLTHYDNRAIAAAVRRATEALQVVQATANHLTTIIPRPLEDLEEESR